MHRAALLAFALLPACRAWVETGGPGSTGTDGNSGASGGSDSTGAFGGVGGNSPLGSGGTTTGGLGGSGGSACPEGWGDCDGEPGCETDLMSSVDHCGGCASPCNIHSSSTCVAGQCVVGSCRDGFADCDQDASNGCEISYCHDCADPCNCPRQDLAVSNVCYGGSVAIDSSSVYWSSGSQVYWAAKNCGTPTLLATVSAPADIVADGRSVYVLHGVSENLARIAIESGDVTTLATGLGSCVPTDDANNIYLACGGQVGLPDHIVVVPKAGGAVTPLIEDLAGVTGLAIDLTNIYFSVHGSSPNDGYIAVMPLGGGTPTILVNQPKISSLAMDEERLYWTTADDHALWSMPKSSGALEFMTSHESLPQTLMVGGTHIYWREFGYGYIARFALDGDSVEIFNVYPFVSEMAVDESTVYWNTADPPQWGQCQDEVLSAAVAN